MNRRFSLRTAIIMPYMLVMIILAVSVILIWQSNYQYLANQQGVRIVSAISENTNKKINAFIGEPHHLNAIFAKLLSQMNLYDINLLGQRKAFALEFVSAQRLQLPQISVASYGDEQGRYLGYRVNDDGTYSLMRLDEKTNRELLIYSDQTESSQILAALENYDPRIRPWYKPVRENPVSQWSEIYINMDEKNESAISTISPIVDSKGKLKGVAALDVKLSGIQKFLASDQARGSGLIYIVDRDWHLVAASGDYQTVKVIAGESPKAEMLVAVESEFNLISESASLLRQSAQGFNEVSRVVLDGAPYYLLANDVDPLLNLGWKVIVAIPEGEIMSGVRDNTNVSAALMFGIIITTTLVGIFMMNRVTQPLLSVSHAVDNLSKGQWGIELPLGRRPLYEIYELVTAFNRMSVEISNNLMQIQSLHEKEKSDLESAVAERTKALQKTMQELINREKLASLGSLVSGISHEINTPLGVSVTAASYMDEANKQMQALMTNNTITKNDFVKYIESMEESALILNTNLSRAAELIKSFKEIAVNQSTEALITFNVSEYIQTVITSLKHEYKHTQHQFIVNCSNKLLLESYPGAWSQILTNFIINSLRHGFTDKQAGTITISVIEKAELIQLIYSDDGIGIDPLNHARVFEPFYTTRRGTGGSGLGLSIIYNLVTGILKGSIALESETGRGVTFTIEIPHRGSDKN